MATVPFFVPRTDAQCVEQAERACDALDAFLSGHLEEMNALRCKQHGTHSPGMDVPATLASFRLFFMLSARAGAPVDAIRFTFLNKNGLDLHYGFVWLSAA